MRRLRLDRRVGLLLGGVILASFVALGASVALPASDPDLAGKPPELSALSKRGAIVYRNEGCWYCHTQYLRETILDTQFGEIRRADDYLGSSPAMLGNERIGPDLTQEGSRLTADGLVAFLRDPGKEKFHTAMPAYGYLGEGDLRALAVYLLSLR